MIETEKITNTGMTTDEEATVVAINTTATKEIRGIHEHTTEAVEITNTIINVNPN